MPSTVRCLSTAIWLHAKFSFAEAVATACVYAPLGLEIGALSPEEIALSITAELVAVRRNAQSAQHKKLQRERRETAASASNAPR